MNESIFPFSSLSFLSLHTNIHTCIQTYISLILFPSREVGAYCFKAHCIASEFFSGDQCPWQLVLVWCADPGNEPMELACTFIPGSAGASAQSSLETWGEVYLSANRQIIPDVSGIQETWERHWAYKGVRDSQKDSSSLQEGVQGCSVPLNPKCLFSDQLHQKQLGKLVQNFRILGPISWRVWCCILKTSHKHFLLFLFQLSSANLYPYDSQGRGKESIFHGNSTNQTFE